jgi:hypothetical protein
MRTLRCIPALMLLCLWTANIPAEPVEDLYRAETIVTGVEEPERSRGLRETFAEVVVKLTGDPRVAKDPVLTPLLQRVGDLVERIEYEDRMKGIPVHDEQGTRERPHYLRVRFRSDAVERALAELGIARWPADRPVIAVWFAVRTPAGSYVLQPQGSAGYGQRVVFEETARRRGIPIVLAPQKPDRPAITPDDVTAFAASRIMQATARGDALLVATLDLADSGYWNVRWLLDWNGKVARWGLDGVMFDTAIKDGLQQTALILSARS